MRHTRVVVRFEVKDREALDRLRERYFAETKRGISRAAIVRTLVSMGLTGADLRNAAEVLPLSVLAAASMRACPPRSKRPCEGKKR
jgi:hypothetical protein